MPLQKRKRRLTAIISLIKEVCHNSSSPDVPNPILQQLQREKVSVTSIYKALAVLGFVSYKGDNRFINRTRRISDIVAETLDGLDQEYSFSSVSNDKTSVPNDLSESQFYQTLSERHKRFVAISRSTSKETIYEDTTFV